MIGLKIAVLDTDRFYLEGLQAYLIRKKDIFFQILLYSEPEEYIASDKSVDALLVTGDLWDAATGKRAGVRDILLHEGWVPKTAKGADAVAKYQSAEDLFRQLAAIFWQEGLREDTLQYAKKSRLLGVYSPCHTEMQLLVTLSMAAVLSEQEKVLYVNLMENSGFYGLTEVYPKEDIGDLFYGMQNRTTDFMAGLHSVRSSLHGFDYIPPVLNPEHLSEVSTDLYERLFHELIYNSGYDTVLIDFGRIFFGFAEITGVLERLYCVSCGSKAEHYAAEEFKAYMDRAAGCGDRQIETIVLPEIIGQRESMHTLESILYGETGRFMRGYLYGDTKEQD